MKNQNGTNKKWNDGRMLQGAYRQWLYDKYPEALELKVIDTIARYTLGFRRRYAYIKEEEFRLSHNKKWRQMKKAKNMGLLEYHRTKAYTMYKLVLSDEIEQNAVWRSSGSIEEEAGVEIEEDQTFLERINNGN